MTLRDGYRRYRAWATQFDQRTLIVAGAAMGSLAAGILSLSGPDGRRWILHHVLPWLLVVGGPIAAFDAWGASHDRGEPGAGNARAVVIMMLCWGGALALWLR